MKPWMAGTSPAMTTESPIAVEMHYSRSMTFSENRTPLFGIML
jgi:hypothetical protein